MDASVVSFSITLNLKVGDAPVSSLTSLFEETYLTDKACSRISERCEKSQGLMQLLNLSISYRHKKGCHLGILLHLVGLLKTITRRKL
ncbi:hypothetical protein ETS21_15065 [Vibrio parahaemolyticus]|nr:hypothetical protein [Vibrio parahaemolyticus]